MSTDHQARIVALERAMMPAAGKVLSPEDTAVLQALLAEIRQAQPETGGPDYRCVMCDKPIAVACKDCTEYAYDAVGYPVEQEPAKTATCVFRSDGLCETHQSLARESDRPAPSVGEVSE